MTAFRRLMIVLLVSLLIIGTVIFCLSVSTRLVGEQTTPLGVARNSSQYIVMSDGSQIALDIWLPKDVKKDEKLPVLLSMTRYWRAGHIGWLQRVAYGLGLIDVSPDLSPTVEYLNTDKFIVIKVDARGTGASGGDRVSEWSPAEIKDFGEVAHWASGQPWSNGNVGALGVSYSGNTAEMLTITQSPSVRAVAPLFSDFDPQFHNAMPGGAFNTGFITGWGHANSALDANNVCLLADVPQWACFAVKWWTRGVKPVDEDSSEAMLDDILRSRKSNNVLNAMETVTFRDDVMKDSGGLQLKHVSPVGQKEKIETSTIPMLVFTGWMDAATTDGAIARFQTFSNPQEVYIGAWSHGGQHDTDPFVDAEMKVTPSYKEQLGIVSAFFEKHLREGAVPIADKSIQYYTMGARTWSGTSQWPPANIEHISFKLSTTNQIGQGEQRPNISYDVDFATSSGSSTRWHTQANGGDVVYHQNGEHVKKRLVFRSAPAESHLEITGTPILSLSMSTTADDGLVIAYLEAVSPEGDILYLTEGVLRLLHRKASRELLLPNTYRIYRTFDREDRALVVPGEEFIVELPLIATSFQLPKGYRLQVVLAGADDQLFDHLPAQEEATWTVNLDALKSSIALPVKGGSDNALRAFSTSSAPFILQ